MTRYVKLVNGIEIDMTSQEISDRQAQESLWESKKDEFQPSEMEIRIAALEAKVGITEQDQENALQELKSK